MLACGQAVGCGVCATRQSSGVAPQARARVRVVYARVLVAGAAESLSIYTYISVP